MTVIPEKNRRRLLAVCACVALAAHILPVAATAQENPTKCRYVKLAEIPFEMMRRSPMITGRVNGQAASLLLDTGATETNLFEHYVKKHGWALRHESGVFFGAGGNSQAYSMRAASFAIDKIETNNLRVRVLADVAMFKADGVVGAEFLMQHDLELDVASKKIRFFHPLNCESGFLAYWDSNASSVALESGSSKDLRPIMNVLLNGKTVRALLDTGAENSVLDQRIVKELGLTVPPSTDNTKNMVGIGRKPMRFQQMQFGSLKIGEEEIVQPTLAVADLWANAQADNNNADSAGYLRAQPQLILGMDFLQHYRILLARSQNTMYFSHVGGQRGN